MSTNILTPIEHAIRAIASAPRIRANCIHWMGDISVPAIVAMAIVGAADQFAAVTAIADGSGASVLSLQNFARARKADGSTWPALRQRLEAAGVKWNETKQYKTKAADTAPADPVAPVTFEWKDPPRAVAPITEVVSPIKTTPLAVTNKGEVITAAPPTSATVPLAMIAKPGDFATKTDATRTVLDTKTRDILVITTKRIEYGTPEWCAKMVEINSKPKS